MHTPPLVYADAGQRRCLRALYPLISADAPTTWIHVAMEGVWEGHPTGPFAFTRALFETVVRNFAKNPNPLPLDYEHATEFAIPAPACGWVQKLEVRGGGSGAELWAFVELGDEAATFIREGRYRFSSAVIDFESIDLASGEAIGAEMLSLALTNVPFIRGQKPIQLSRRRALAVATEEPVMTFSKETLARALEMIEGDEISMEQLQAMAHAAAAADGALEEPAAPEEPAAMASDDGEGDDEREPAAMTAGTFNAPVVTPTEPVSLPPEQEAAALLEQVLAQTGMSVEELVASLQQMASQQPASDAPLSVLSRRQGETIAQLTSRLSAAEKQLRGYAEREAQDAVDELVRSGRLLDVARAEMVALRLSNRKAFDAVASALPQSVPVGEHAAALTPPTVESPAINEDDVEVKELRRWLKAAGVPKGKQDDRIRRELANRRGNNARV